MSGIRSWPAKAACIALMAWGAAQAETRALLIGVSHYPHLAGKDLAGPPNDLRLMQGLLTEHLAVAPGQVKQLSEAEGPIGWPTRSNILKALAHLASTSQAGDWAIVYYAGHGSQVPQTRATHASFVEPDGLDEVILPRDTRQWDAKRRLVRGAILDDEIGKALAKISAKGAKVWAIFDTCHAGDMTRGPASGAASVVVSRHVDPIELAVPMAALLDRPRPPPAAGSPVANGPLRQHSGANESLSAKRMASWPTSGQSPWIAFFAAHPEDNANEASLPDPVRPDTVAVFGVFTHHLAALAKHWNGTFAELAEGLERAAAKRRAAPPMFQGGLNEKPSFALTLEGTAP